MPLQASSSHSSISPARGSQPSVRRNVSSWMYGALACSKSACSRELQIL